MIAKETEYLLIGSGVAAVTLAERLLAANPNTNVTILEAGEVYRSQDRRAWWDYVMTGKANYNPAVDTRDEYRVESNVDWDCNDNRLIAYGGSTLHWGGWSLRFKPEDFHLRSNTGMGADWPFLTKCCTTTTTKRRNDFQCVGTTTKAGTTSGMSLSKMNGERR